MSKTELIVAIDHETQKSNRQFVAAKKWLADNAAVIYDKDLTYQMFDGKLAIIAGNHVVVIGPRGGVENL